jgi:putative ABC transport system ATP-binding protein
MKMIELKNVTKIYKAGEKQVYGLRNLSLSITKGDFVVIIGPSGCGKSTLLNLVGGIDTPTKGEIIVDSQNLANLNDKELTNFRKRKIGFVFQFFNLISTLTAIENVELSLKLRGVTGLKARKEAERYLDMVGILELKDRFPSELSGGEQQRVGIARALAKNPVVLLADEPTGNLDTKSSQKVISTMHNSTRKLDTTVMVVTHNSAIAESAKHVVVLRDGEVVENKARLE